MVINGQLQNVIDFDFVIVARANNNTNDINNTMVNIINSTNNIIRWAFRPRGVCDNLISPQQTIILFICMDPSVPNRSPRRLIRSAFSTIGRSMGRFGLIFDQMNQLILVIGIVNKIRTLYFLSDFGFKFDLNIYVPFPLDVYLSCPS